MISLVLNYRDGYASWRHVTKQYPKDWLTTFSVTNAMTLQPPNLQNFRILAARILGVMPETSSTHVACKADVEEFSVSQYVKNLILELHRAKKAWPIYQEASNLPAQDLFAVGGNLQALIDRAELELAYGEQYSYPQSVMQTISSYLEEIKAFRKYIVTRIRQTN